VDDPEDYQAAAEYLDLRVTIGFQDPSLKLFFRRISNAGQDLLHVMPSAAHFAIFQDIYAILVTPNDEAIKAQQQRCNTFATDYWLFHLGEIRSENLEQDEIRLVLQALDSILHNEGRAVGKIASGFGATYSMLGQDAQQHTKGLSTIRYWANHAQERCNSELPGQRILETMQAIGNDDRQVLWLLVRGAIASWLSYGNNPMNAMTLFHSARKTLKLSKTLLEHNGELLSFLDEFVAEDDLDDLCRVPEKGLRLMAELFPEFMTSPEAQYALATALAHCGHREASIEVCRSGLEMSTEALDTFMLQSRLGRTLSTSTDVLIDVPYADRLQEAQLTEEEPEARISRYREAHIHLDAAIAIASTSDLGSAYVSEAEIAQLISTVHQHRIQCQIELGTDVEVLLRAVADYQTNAQKQRGSGELRLEHIIPALARREEWDGIMRLVRLVGPATRQWYLERVRDPAADLARAAAETGQIDYVLQMYDEFEKRHRYIEWAFRPIAFHYVDIYCQVLGAPSDLQAAKARLRDYLDKQPRTAGWQVRTGDISLAYQHLADIVFEEFRAAKMVDAKAGALVELKKVVGEVTEFFGKSFDASQSQLTIPLARMQKRLGPTADYIATLDGVFRGCIDALHDDVSWNDGASLRMLAKVLQCAAPKDEYFQHAASVAASCRLYILDMEIWKRGQETVIDGSDGDKWDMDKGASIRCDACSKAIKSWTDDVAYLCTYCTGTELCLACFDERAASEKSAERPWRVICPKGHRHVKAPVQGWRGVKNGILHFETRQIKFQDWLDQVKTSWATLWERFWDEDD
jgi:hypothetical protein